MSAIADATHINKVSRAKLLRNLKLDGVKVVAIYFDTPKEVCFERNSKRVGRQLVPQKAMESMARFYSTPKENEGFHQIIKVDKEDN